MGTEGGMPLAKSAATPHIEAKNVPFHMQYGSLMYPNGLQTDRQK